MLDAAFIAPWTWSRRCTGRIDVTHQRAHFPSDSVNKSRRCFRLRTRAAVESVKIEDSVSPSTEELWDVVVVGSGFGGLSCAALTSAMGFKTLVLESHYAPGGVAHGFEVTTKAGLFHFDTGPSFFCGLSSKRSLNPLKMVLDAVGEHVKCTPYDRFCIDDLRVGTVEVCADEAETLRSLAKISPAGAVELKRFNDVMRSMYAGMDVPAIALRGDALVVPMIFRRWASSMLKLLPFVGDMKRPVADILNRVAVRDPFTRMICDVEAFLLSGLKASGTITAEIAFMVGERSQKNAIGYPIGGARAIVKALVRGIEKHGSEVRLKSHVEEIVVQSGRAIGVKLKGRGATASRRIRARKAVVSNASIWDTFGSLVKAEHLPPSFVRDAETTPAVESFMHLHMAIPADGLKPFIGHHAVIIDSSKDIAAPGNTVMISVPTVWSPTMAPDGWHIVHAYTLEEYDKWPALAKNREDYLKAKDVAAEPLYTAVRSVIPDLDERLKHPDAFVKLGSPLTHARFCRRYKGSYGPAIVAGKGEFPWPRTPIRSLLRVGDSVFPGIGVPAAATSGVVAATSLIGFHQHALLVDKIFPAE